MGRGLPCHAAACILMPCQRPVVCGSWHAKYFRPPPTTCLLLLQAVSSSGSSRSLLQFANESPKQILEIESKCRKQRMFKDKQCKALTNYLHRCRVHFRPLHAEVRLRRRWPTPPVLVT